MGDIVDFVGVRLDRIEAQMAEIKKNMDETQAALDELIVGPQRGLINTLRTINADDQRQRRG